MTQGEATGAAPAPSEAGRRGRLGNWGKTALLACFSATIGLVFLELAVRLIEPRDALREYFEGHDAVLHHKFIPGARGRHKTLEFDAAYAINSLGLRSGELARDKPPGSKRILMLGDSFTEGNGVQQSETFSSLLQARLDGARVGEKLEIVNAGVGSYSALLELLYLKTAGLAAAARPRHPELRSVRPPRRHPVHPAGRVRRGRSAGCSSPRAQERTGLLADQAPRRLQELPEAAHPHL